MAPQETKARYATTSEPRDRLFSVGDACVRLEWGRRVERLLGPAVRVRFTAPCHFQIIAQGGLAAKPRACRTMLACQEAREQEGE
jgi:hypothetical protein